MTETLSAYLEPSEDDDDDDDRSMIERALDELREALRQCVPDDWVEITAEISRSDMFQTGHIRVTSYESEEGMGWYYTDYTKAIDALIDGIREYLEQISGFVQTVELSVTIDTEPDVLMTDDGIEVCVQ